MKIYTCKSFTGHWPVGTAAVVIAATPEGAAYKLNKELQEEHGLPGDAKPEDMVEFPSTQQPIEQVRVILDGNY